MCVSCVSVSCDSQGCCCCMRMRACMWVCRCVHTSYVRVDGQYVRTYVCTCLVPFDFDEAAEHQYNIGYIMSNTYVRVCLCVRDRVRT